MAAFEIAMPPEPENDELLNESMENEGSADASSGGSPRKQARRAYAAQIGNPGKEHILQNIPTSTRPKQMHLIAEILFREPTAKPNNWKSQQMANWLHQHPPANVKPVSAFRFYELYLRICILRYDLRLGHSW